MAGEGHPDETRQTLVVATRNPGKLEEMRELLGVTDWDVEELPADVPEYEETGSTFAENARGKALHASNFTDLPVLADDSGLEIDVLGGEPGVHSARYIDPTADQDKRNRAVLEKLQDVPPDQRAARFICHLVLAHRGRVIFETEGRCEGFITQEPRGTGGFGYDPIFRVQGLERTFAELTSEEKSARSHRGAAARAMAIRLADWSPVD